MWKTRSSSAQRLATAQRVEQLAALLAAGTPLPTAAAALARTESHPRLAQELGQVAARLEQGAPLGEALEPLGLGQLATGDDPTRALQRLARHLRRRAELRITWRRALAYPTLLLCLLVGGWFALPYLLAPVERLLATLGAGAPTMPAAWRFVWASGPRQAVDVAVLAISGAVVYGLLRGPLRRLLYGVQRRSGILRRLTAAELLEATALRLHLEASPTEAVGQALTETLRRSASTPISLEAGLSGWLQPLELLPLIAAQQRSADAAELATVAEGIAADLHDEAQRRIALVGPISVAALGLGILLVAWGFAAPLLGLGSRIGGS